MSRYALAYIRSLPTVLFVAAGCNSEEGVRAFGQEAVRVSLAGEAAAESRHKAASSPDYFNLRLGPSACAFSFGVDWEANDNISFASADRKFDVITRPQLNTRIALGFSDKNSVSLALGIGYSAYARNPEFNRLFITPGSELAFDLYAGPFWINLHERLSVSENEYADPTLIGTADYSQLQNVVGLGGTWDLNKLVVRSGYDHANYVTLRGGGIPEGQSDVLGFSVGFRWGPAGVIGAEGGGGLIEYSGDDIPVPKAWDWNVGTFWEAQPTKYISLKIAAGYTVYAPDNNAAQNVAEEFTGVYARLGLSHRVNRHLDYFLQAERSINFGFFSGTVDLYTGLLEARWHLFQKLSLSTGFEFEHGKELTAGCETFDRFGPRMSLERPLTSKMSAVLRYQYYQRQSNLAEGDYGVNLVTLSIVYRL
jgi:hypothetical protein